VDNLSRALGVGRLWDGHADIPRYGLFRRETLGRAPDGVRRAALCIALVITARILVGPARFRAKAASVRQRLGLAEDDGPAVISARLVEVAERAGFGPAELADLRTKLAGTFRRFDPCGA
jgi:hypothetical protein